MATDHKILLAILLLSPLLGFFINGLRFRSPKYQLAGTVASLASGISFLCSLLLLFQLMGLEKKVLTAHYFDWLVVGDFKAAIELTVDPIALVMLMVVTGVGSLIHIFSIGYISHDERPTKYFAYLNLFLFNMLLLVLGSNLLVMFVGWEGVGLCSYLLIGFWFKDKEKAAAGMKAFIVNRIGDAGFLLGIFLLFVTFGTVDFAELTNLMPGSPEIGWGGPVTLACLLLFVGAIGKSAQIPLYVWLPDAMAGPTPVSALIHAATMVTAGVYMMVRMSAVYMVAPNAMMVVAVIGALTALMAATIALTQWDIKKILAYSTISQLGYMFLAVGVGAFMPALFHLMTHAFFKALMFLCSGSVIHALDGEQDIRKMGGLRRYMPITYWAFFFGWLAIIGLPPFAGFFSKDEILWYTFASPSGHPILWVVGVIASGVTAFYMTRLMSFAFWGDCRVAKKAQLKESSISMTVPLIILGFLSIVGGLMGIPHVISAVLPGHPPHFLEGWTLSSMTHAKIENPSALLEWLLMGFSVGVASIAAWFAYDTYIKNKSRAQKMSDAWGRVHTLVSNKYFVDEFYSTRVINPVVHMSKGLWFYIDINFIDKATYLLTDFVRNCGSGLKAIQNGNLQRYAMFLIIGLAVVLSFALMG